MVPAGPLTDFVRLVALIISLLGSMFSIMKKCLFFLLLFCSIGHAEPRILILGDSLSAGYGFDQKLGWAELLQRKLADSGYSHQVINASISGDTTAGGLTRLPQLLQKYRPQWLIVELGGNDGLRGLSLAQTEDNIRQMVHLGRIQQSQVLLLGMMLPPNFGKTFTRKFQLLYQTVAQQMALPLVPFFLEGVATKPEWMQGDGIHPNAKGQPTLLQNIWQVFAPELEKSKATTNKLVIQ